MAIGPRPADLPSRLASTPFLNYQLALVVAADHPLAGQRASAEALRAVDWCLGPSAVSGVGLVPDVVRAVGVPESRQRIFQNHTAAVEEAKRGTGIAPALSFSVGKDLATGALGSVTPPAGVRLGSAWELVRVRASGDGAPSTVDELARFVTTPRAIQAMVKGTGVTPGRFRPAVHVTLWS